MAQVETLLRRMRNGIYERFTQEGETFSELEKYWYNWGIQHSNLAWAQSLIDNMIGIGPLFRHITELDRQIPDKGVGFFAKAFLAKINCQTIWDDGVPEWLQQEGVPVLAFGNHTNRIEHLSLLASSERNDLRSIGATWASVPGREYQKALFLVTRVPRDGEVVRFAGVDHNREAAKEFNRNSYRQATDHLFSGGSIVIAPNATYNMHRDTLSWKGIGRIMANMDAQKQSEIRLAPLYTYGVSIGDILTNLRQAYTGGEVEPLEMHIKQGHVFTVADLLSENSGQVQQVNRGELEDKAQFFNELLQRKYESNQEYALL